MLALSDVIGAPLEWKQPSAMAKNYVLLAGETEVARLEFRSIWRSLATGSTAGGCWTFDRGGFLKTTTTIRRCEESEDRGIFRDNTWSNGGTLELGEQRYKITTNLWMNRFEILNEREWPLVRFDTGGFLRSHGKVEIAAPNEDNLALLILFGWYIIIVLVEEASAAAG